MRRGQSVPPESPGTPRSLVIVRPTLAQGGADRVTVTLLNTLDRSLVTPTLVLFRREGPYLEDVPKDVPIQTLQASSLWTAWWPLASHLKRRRPDILFSSCSGTNVVACIASLLSGRRSRLVLSERNVLLRDQPFAKKWLMLLAKRLLYRIADNITTVSQGVAEDLVAKLSLEPNRMRVVYNPIVGPELKGLADEEVDEPPFGGTAPIVLAAGRLVPAKSFDVLLRSFAVVARAQAANLVILGDGPLREKLQTQIADLGIRDRVFLPGFVENPFRYMARSTVFVLSSRYEGLPGVLIQAMACGLPVISTDCSAGPSEIITPEENGILVPVGSAEALAEELSRLLRDPDLRARLGEGARKRARDFRVEPVVNEYLRVLVGDEGLGSKQAAQDSDSAETPASGVGPDRQGPSRSAVS